MINWNTDEKQLKQNNPKEYEIWKVTQQINYGLWDGERLNRNFLLDNWETIKNNIDIESVKAIEFHLWNKKWDKQPGLRKDKKNS